MRLRRIFECRLRPPKQHGGLVGSHDQAVGLSSRSLSRMLVLVCHAWGVTMSTTRIRNPAGLDAVPWTDSRRNPVTLRNDTIDAPHTENRRITKHFSDLIRPSALLSPS